MKNMKIAKLAIGVITVILLTSCASKPTQNELLSADYGRDMSPEECVSIAQDTISRGLKDPSSAQFRHGTCVKGYWSSVPIMSLKKAYGWYQVGEVNAKNSYGGYVGFKPYQILMKDGYVVRYCITDNKGYCVPK